MNLSPVIEQLRLDIGIAPDSLDAGALSRVVTTRMRALQLTAPGAYALRLAGDAQELQFLLHHLAIPETWFFRGGQLFAYLAARVAEAGRLHAPGKKFRILSVPCSTGEEPYSLAIALAEAGVPHSTWEIDAVDLSEAHIERARRGWFSNFSFRQTDADLRDRYFKPLPNTSSERGGHAGWELDSGIRSRVSFRQGNLLDTAVLSGEGPFDLIFCRNLLIYLDPDARRQVFDMLHGLLAPDGWLCTGTAEPLEFQDSRFTRIGPVEHFTYCKGPVAKGTVDGGQCSVDGGQWSTGALAAAALPRSPTPIPIPHSTPGPSSALVDSLATARELADGGQLDDALVCCRELMVRSDPSADLYSLMGVIHQALRERDEAIRCFQRALYLNPNHAEAMAHLLLLYQEQGNDAQVQRLRRRLERVVPGGQP